MKILELFHGLTPGWILFGLPLGNPLGLAVKGRQPLQQGWFFAGATLCGCPGLACRRDEFSLAFPFAGLP